MKREKATRYKVNRGRARDEQIIALLMAGKPVNEISTITGLDRSTLWKRRSAPEFQAAFLEARRTAFEAAVNTLHDNATLFTSTLAGICRDPNARGSEKATAARSGLDSLWRATELFNLDERIRKLEAAAESGGKNEPATTD